MAICETEPTAGLRRPGKSTNCRRSADARFFEVYRPSARAPGDITIQQAADLLNVSRRLVRGAPCSID
jgi:hypothetical protein